MVLRSARASRARGAPLQRSLLQGYHNFTFCQVRYRQVYSGGLLITFVYFFENIVNLK